MHHTSFSSLFSPFLTKNLDFHKSAVVSVSNRYIYSHWFSVIVRLSRLWSDKLNFWSMIHEKWVWSAHTHTTLTALPKLAWTVSGWVYWARIPWLPPWSAAGKFKCSIVPNAFKWSTCNVNSVTEAEMLQVTHHTFWVCSSGACVIFLIDKRTALLRMQEK